MKTLFLITASAVALTGMAACAPTSPPKARASLDCPQVEGDLTRASQAADGKTCVYRTPGGDEVTLQLVSTGGDPKRTLEAMETSLLAPLQQAAAADAVADKAADKATDASATASEAAKDAARSAEDAAKDASDAPMSDSDDNVSVHLPGVHVEARERGPGGDTARINLPGVQIIADDATDSADIRVGGMHIQAHDKTATIRVWKDVRLRGEAFSREKRGLRASFIHTGEDLPQGYRGVGYEAGGPKAGPLTVAVVRSREAENIDFGDGVYKDIQRLVRRNGGV